MFSFVSCCSGSIDFDKLLKYFWSTFQKREIFLRLGDKYLSGCDGSDRDLVSHSSHSHSSQQWCYWGRFWRSQGNIQSLWQGALHQKWRKNFELISLEFYDVLIFNILISSFLNSSTGWRWFNTHSRDRNCHQSSGLLPKSKRFKWFWCQHSFMCQESELSKLEELVEEVNFDQFLQLIKRS